MEEEGEADSDQRVDRWAWRGAGGSVEEAGEADSEGEVMKTYRKRPEVWEATHEEVEV